MTDMLESQLTATKVLLRIARAGHRTNIADDALLPAIEKRLGDVPHLVDLDEVAKSFVADNAAIFTQGPAGDPGSQDKPASGHPDPDKQTEDERRDYLKKQGII